MGQLLPAEGNVDADDVAALSEAKLILAGMEKVKSKIDAILRPPARDDAASVT